MPGKRLINRRGVTITELAIAIAVSSIVTLVVGVVLVDGHRGWTRMYNRAYSDVVTDSYVARKTFDSVIRKASREMFLIDNAGTWIEIYYYSSSSADDVNRYARFYTSGDQLYVEYGTLDPRTTTSVESICSNVSSCVFKSTGRSIQMILTLDNGSQSATVTTSAVMHNE
ncbi:MAG: hypothetical protein ACYTBJ_08120 [Planctomycetota bacterium]|jgi:hypothetical protein